MNDKQTETYASLAKSYDFMDDNSANSAITSIVQLVGLTTVLGNTLEQIIESDGIGKQNNKGITIDKSNKREVLTIQFYRVANAAAAYYLSIGDPITQKNVTFTPKESIAWSAEELYSRAKKLVKDTTPAGDNLIGAGALDISNLDNYAEAFNDVIPDTKRAQEFSKVHNAKIDPLLKTGRETQATMDVFMKTLITNYPDLYAEWAETLNIDKHGSNNPAALSLEATIAAGETTTIDYGAFELANNSEIKLINGNDASIDYGFGSTNDTFATTPTTVNEQSQTRKTATALGYHSIDSNKLNVRNNSEASLTVTLEFYDMG